MRAQWLKDSLSRFRHYSYKDKMVVKQFYLWEFQYWQDNIFILRQSHGTHFTENFPSWFKFYENIVRSHSNSNILVRTKFCINLIIRIRITAKWISHWVQNMSDNFLVKKSVLHPSHTQSTAFTDLSHTGYGTGHGGAVVLLSGFAVQMSYLVFLSVDSKTR